MEHSWSYTFGSSLCLQPKYRNFGVENSSWLRERLPQWFTVDMTTNYRSSVYEDIAYLHAEFHPDYDLSHLAAVASEGAIKIADCRNDRLLVIDEIECTLPLEIRWRPTLPHLIYPNSGDSNSSLAVFNIDTKNVEIENLGSHQATIRSIACLNKDILAVGCRDGSITSYDLRMRANKVISVICDSHSRLGTRQVASSPSLSSKAVSSLIFHSSHYIISSGSTDGKMKVWDARMHYTSSRSVKPLHTYSYCGQGKRPYGFTNLAVTSDDQRLFAYCMDQSIYSYNMNNHSNDKLPDYIYDVTITDKDNIYDYSSKMYVKMCISPNDTHLLTGSCSQAAYILQICQPDRPATKLPTSDHHITSSNTNQDVACCCAVAWNKHNINQVLTADDGGHLSLWTLSPSRTSHLLPPPLDQPNSTSHLTAQPTTTCNNRFMPHLNELRKMKKVKSERNVSSVHGTVTPSLPPTNTSLHLPSSSSTSSSTTTSTTTSPLQDATATHLNTQDRKRTWWRSAGFISTPKTFVKVKRRTVGKSKTLCELNNEDCEIVRE